MNHIYKVVWSDGNEFSRCRV
ncbi:ESPR-type extended signal peptide-containing protein [Actinobacillus equuli subsp. haemolyticus]|nr:ESPR-type extended signal peptide-containing protein [Actinobacillus equuli]MDG4948018.1 ESPR-type extended signal peptide-containing protein [Actinobacillus equuli subsp. haemolyticus]